MGDLSPHFSSSEFACKGPRLAGHPPHPVHVHDHLIQHLEKLRSIKGGRPLPIVSGHRCRWYNSKIRGASSSRHIVCDAADIPAGYATVDEAVRAGFTGIGRKGQWAIHVDTRPTPARWSYG